MDFEEGWGFVLHLKPFQDNKKLADVLIADKGRVRLVVHNKKQEYLSVLTRYQFCYYGNNELKTCHRYESLESYQRLSGKALYCSLYVNELLMRVLPTELPIEDLMPEYQRVLLSLSFEDTLELSLRQFEFWLLDSLGYACDWFTDAHSGQAVAEGKSYGFSAQEGVFELDPAYADQGIPGEHLLDIFEGYFELPGSLAYAKWLSREAFNTLLGNRPLLSRQLFQQMKQQILKFS